MYNESHDNRPLESLDVFTGSREAQQTTNTSLQTHQKRGSKGEEGGRVGERERSSNLERQRPTLGKSDKQVLNISL